MDQEAYHPGRNEKETSMAVAELVDRQVEEARVEVARQEGMRESIASSTLVEAVPVNTRRSNYIIAAIVATILVGLAIGLTVPLSKQDDSSDTLSCDPDLLASIKLVGSAENSVFLLHARIETRSFNNNFAKVTTGLMNEINCKPLPCLEDPANCSFVSKRVYEPGCCLGSECNEALQCGHLCPSKLAF